MICNANFIHPAKTSWKTITGDLYFQIVCGKHCLHYLHLVSISMWCEPNRWIFLYQNSVTIVRFGRSISLRQSLFTVFPDNIFWNSCMLIVSKCTIHVTDCHDKMETFYFETWKSQWNQSKKLEFYKLFKHGYESNYLDIIRNFDQRHQLCKLRISNHELAIDTGHYSKEKIYACQRICLLCSKHAVETELHFIFSCPL